MVDVIIKLYDYNIFALRSAAQTSKLSFKYIHITISSSHIGYLQHREVKTLNI